MTDIPLGVTTPIGSVSTTTNSSFAMTSPPPKPTTQRQRENRKEKAMAICEQGTCECGKTQACYLESETGVEQQEGSKTALEPTIPLPLQKLDG